MPRSRAPSKPAGLVFIGPTAETSSSGSATRRPPSAKPKPPMSRPSPAARRRAKTPPKSPRIVRELGLPVMLKAAAGGGGKGMRAVAGLDGLAGEIESAMREAKSAFGYRRADRRKADRARAAYRSPDRRRRQRQRDPSVRARMFAAAAAPEADRGSAGRQSSRRRCASRMVADAVRLGERLNYRGVGTVEFILSARPLLFPGGQSAPSGRAPRHRNGDRHRYRRD